MKITISNLGRFRLNSAASQATGSRATVKMISRIAKKTKLTEHEVKDMGNGRFIINKPEGTSEIDFEEAEIDWLESFFTGPYEGFSLLDTDEENGWIPNFERQIAEARPEPQKESEKV